MLLNVRNKLIFYFFLNLLIYLFFYFFFALSAKFFQAKTFIPDSKKVSPIQTVRYKFPL